MEWMKKRKKNEWQGKKSNVTHWIWIEVEHIDGNVEEEKRAEKNTNESEWTKYSKRGLESTFAGLDYNVRLLKCNFRILDVNDVMTTSRHNLAVVAAITITTEATAHLSALTAISIHVSNSGSLLWASITIVMQSMNESCVLCCCYTFWLFAKIDV